MAEPKTYTIIHADGLYSDDKVEQEILAPRSDEQDYKIDYHQVHLSIPGKPPKPWSTIPEALRNKVDGITTLRVPLRGDDVSLFPNLKVIVRMGVGYDMLDRATLAAHNVTVCNVPDYGTAEIADHALALALSLRRGIILHHETQRTGGLWTPTWTPLVSRLQRSTFGILGLGRIGTAAALRAKAFGFKVLFYDPYLPNGVDKSLDIERTKDIRELFQRSNVLSVHCQATPETKGLVDYSLLSLLPKGAILVNTSRGEVVNLDGVEQALKENLAGAGLDVLPQEPIPEPAHSLIQAYRNKEAWLEGRLVITPHVAYFSPESFEDIRVKSAETIKDVLIDGGKSNVITPEMH